ncbi:MAG: NAD(P)-dependent oxidoreductase [Syntrophobacterales bacterium]
MKVLISDNLHQAGVDLLEQHPNIEVDFRPGLSPEELKTAIKEADGLAIRSATKVTADLINAAPLLKVVGRAGTGLDNVDIPSASKRGIVVMNTPGGNTITTAEHAISMMCALARNIPQAAQTMREGLWEKKKYQGTEILNKTLGVIGLGRIGRVVAERALGLKMRVIGYDPFITKEMASSMGVELVSLDELLARSDFITVHTPKTKETTKLLGKKAFHKMKPGIRLINCARGGIVDEAALYDAIKEGKVAAAALDVFETEPPPADFPLRTLPAISSVSVAYIGEVAKLDTKPLTHSILKGLLFPVVGDEVNYVNAPSVAAQRGITVGEEKMELVEDFTNLIRLTVRAGMEENMVAGTIFGKYEPRLIQINKFRLEAIPEGHMLFLYNTDRPGVIGAIGTTIGNHSINIARMTVGQEKERGQNVILLTTDTPLTPECLKAVQDLPHVAMAIQLEL